jgi:hypothetical protein
MQKHQWRDQEGNLHETHQWTDKEGNVKHGHKIIE